MPTMLWHRLKWVAVCMVFVLAAPSSTQAGIILDYQGLDWLIGEASEIVIATGKPPKPPEELKRRADGSPIIDGLPDYMNGALTEVTIQHVLKGSLKDGVTTAVFIPYFEYTSGSVKLEFPVSVSGGMYGPTYPASMLMFLRHSGNTPDLETIPSFASQLQVDETKIQDAFTTLPLKERVLNLIDRNAANLYYPPIYQQVN